MKIITERHKYELQNFENKDLKGQQIQFIQKEPLSENSKELKKFMMELQMKKY